MYTNRLSVSASPCLTTRRNTTTHIVLTDTHQLTTSWILTCCCQASQTRASGRMNVSLICCWLLNVSSGTSQQLHNEPAISSNLLLPREVVIIMMMMLLLLMMMIIPIWCHRSTKTLRTDTTIDSSTQLTNNAHRESVMRWRDEIVPR